MAGLDTELVKMSHILVHVTTVWFDMFSTHSLGITMITYPSQKYHTCTYTPT